MLSDRFLRFSTATDSVIKRIQKYENIRLSSFGIRSMHLMYLYCLDKAEDGMTPANLSRACGVDKAFISRISNHLSERGYIEFEDKTALHCIRYRRKIHLTPAGREVMKQINSIVDSTVDSVTIGVSEDELETFYAVLSKLESNLESLSLSESGTDNAPAVQLSSQERA